MTETIKRKLSDSSAARWTAMLIVSFTMMCGYFITDVMSPLGDMLTRSVVDGGMGWTPTEYGWFSGAYSWLNIFLLMLLFGGIIAWTGISILRKTASDLMDTADERYLEKMLETVSRRPRPDWIDIHNLKIIRYGSYAYIDCDLTLPWYYTVRQGHKACEELKRVIEQSFSDRVLFSVHSDPCEERHCNHCSVEECPYRREAFAGPLVYTLRELTENDEQRSE